MIVGHFGAAYIVRALRKDARLLVLMGAAVLPDVADVVLSATGICNRFGVYSHSIPAVFALAAFAFAIAWLIGDGGIHPGEPAAPRRDWRFASLVALLVMLHMPADWITGIKQLWPGGPIFELDLYRWEWADFALEVPIVVLGWMMLRNAAGPKWGTSRVMLAVLIALQLGFTIAAPFTKHAGTKRHLAVCGPMIQPSP